MSYISFHAKFIQGRKWMEALSRMMAVHRANPFQERLGPVVFSVVREKRHYNWRLFGSLM